MSQTVAIANQTREKLRVALWTKQIEDQDHFIPFNDMKLFNPGEGIFEIPDSVDAENVYVALTKDHVNKRGKLGFKDVLTSDLISVKSGEQVEIHGSFTKGYDITVH